MLFKFPTDQYSKQAVRKLVKNSSQASQLLNNAFLYVSVKKCISIAFSSPPWLFLFRNLDFLII